MIRLPLWAFAAMVLPSSPAFAGNPDPSPRTYFASLCSGEGMVKLPGWPKLSATEKKGLAAARQKKTSSAQRKAAVEIFESAAKDCTALRDHVRDLVSTTDDGERSAKLMTGLYASPALEKEISGCKLPGERKVALFRAAAFGTDDAAQGAKRDDCKSGGLTPQEIMAVIRANLNQIRKCYEELLERQAKAQGKVLVNFQVGLTGKVETAAVTTSTIADDKFQGCIVTRLRAWKFPKPRGSQPVTVNYPFVFNPL